MTESEFTRIFPRASKSTLAANAATMVPPEVISRAAGKKAEPNMVKSKMRQTEREYQLILESEFPHAQVEFEPMKFRIADRCWYCPDFGVFDPTPDHRPLFVEVKGPHIWDDSKVKFKAVQEQHPWFDFKMMQKISGEWRQIL